MAIQLFNTMTGKKEPLTPLHPPQVSVYICGVTVYDLCHAGHARVYAVFDVIFRHLKRRGFEVKVVRNFTDVDDKIINSANKKGMPAQELSERMIREFHTDMGALKVAPVDVEPKVTTHMPEIVEFIEGLIKTGHAYAVDGVGAGKDVYYSVRAFPEYLKLSKRNFDELKAGGSERVDVDERKRDPFDFALWKSAKPGEPHWSSPWGEGRPGWHIECSAMCRKHVGDTVDIHAGGRDLIFPHHENEIAQSEALTGKPLARHWLHNGFLTIDKEKMSKSVGNFFTIRDVLAKVSPDALRYFLLGTHYRSPIDFSDVILDESDRRVEALYETRRRSNELMAATPPEAVDYVAISKGTKAEPLVGAGVGVLFDEAMDDDFNTARALGVVADAMRLSNAICDAKEAELLGKKLSPRQRSGFLQSLWGDLGGLLQVLGVIDEDPDTYLRTVRDRRCLQRGIDPGWVEGRLTARADAKAAKDFAAADGVRQELLARGVVVKDTPLGTRWSVEEKAPG